MAAFHIVECQHANFFFEETKGCSARTNPLNYLTTGEIRDCSTRINLLEYLTNGEIRAKFRENQLT